MATSSELVNEVSLQLEDDILSYGWLRQIARSFHSTASSSEIAMLVEDVIRVLLEQRSIEIGNAVESNGMVVIQPWSGDTQESLARLREVVAGANPDEDAEDGYCFWIARR